MSKSRFVVVAILIIGLVGLVSSGCKKPQPEVTPQEPAAVPPPAPVEAPPERREVEPAPDPTPIVEEPIESRDEQIRRVQQALATIYFDYDKYDLSDDSRATLRDNAGVLRENDNFDVVVEGHCDERGSIEYNLSLGERRAQATRDYLVSLGIPASRVRIISFGEERPEVTGHNESSWAKNRRAAFQVER